MRRVKPFTLDREPCEKPLLTYRDSKGIHSVKLLAARLDEIEVFRQAGKTYVLCWNEKHQYAGLEVYTGHDRVEDVFFESPDLESALGKKRLELSPIAMAKKLAEYLT